MMGTSKRAGRPVLRVFARTPRASGACAAIGRPVCQPILRPPKSAPRFAASAKDRGVARPEGLAGAPNVAHQGVTPTASYRAVIALE